MVAVLGLGVVAGAVAILVAPEIDSGSPSDFGQLYATCAQVCAALTVVIAVEVTAVSFRGLDLSTAAVKAGLVGGVAGMAGALAGTSPHLGDSLYEACFAAAVAGAAMAVATVLILGWQTIDQAHDDAYLTALRRRAALGDSAAKQELKSRGEPLPPAAS